MVNDFEIMLVEGLKTLSLPRIGVFRNSIDKSYFDYIEAAAIDKRINKDEIPKNIDILDLNNIEEIIEWIFKNAKRI